MRVDDPQASFLTMVAALGRGCREWHESATDAVIESMIEDSKCDGGVCMGIYS